MSVAANAWVPLRWLPVQAVRDAGTEVSATAVGGQPRGPRGRWAMVLRRQQRPVTDRSELADEAEAEATGIPEPAGEPATLPATQDVSGQEARDEAHTPKAPPPQ